MVRPYRSCVSCFCARTSPCWLPLEGHEHREGLGDRSAMDARALGKFQKGTACGALLLGAAPGRTRCHERPDLALGEERCAHHARAPRPVRGRGSSERARIGGHAHRHGHAPDRAGAAGEPPHRQWRPRKALPRRAGSREPLANQTFANPHPRGPGSTRSPSRACEWRCMTRCAGASIQARR
jgi:hypothetical protein